MKLNFKVFKKGKALYWIIGAVVLFVVFYLFANRGASSSSAGSGGGVTTINAGPSDAQIMASSQISAAQIAANSQTQQSQFALQAVMDENAAAVALGGLEAQNVAAAINAEKDLGFQALTTQQATDLALIDAERSMFEQNTTLQLEGARLANEQVLGLRQIEANMFNNQLQANANMLQIQSQNLIAQTAFSQVGNLKKKDRDETLQILSGQFGGKPLAFTNPSGSAQITGYS